MEHRGITVTEIAKEVGLPSSVWKESGRVLMETAVGGDNGATWIGHCFSFLQIRVIVGPASHRTTPATSGDMQLRGRAQIVAHS